MIDRVMKSLLAPVALALSAAFGLAACSDDRDGQDSASAVPESADHNQADVDFATSMIQHHAQALSMVDLTVGRKVSPELQALAEQIRATQGPEVEVMVDWLRDWDQPIPETIRDHVNAHGGGHVATDDMPGMVSAEDLEELGTARGAEFEDLFLEMMIEHHEGAIEMAEDEREDGEHPETVDLAGTIIEDQQAEIERMQGLLDD